MSRKWNVVKTLLIRFKVKIDWNSIDVVNRPYDVVDATLVNFQKLRQAIDIKSGNIFGLETNEKSDGRSILVVEAVCFIQKCLELHHQALDGNVILQNKSVYHTSIQVGSYHLLWVKILDTVARCMFSKAVDLKTLIQRLLYDIFK